MKIVCIICGEVFHGNTKAAFMAGWDLSPCQCPECQKPSAPEPDEDEEEPE